MLLPAACSIAWSDAAASMREGVGALKLGSIRAEGVGVGVWTMVLILGSLLFTSTYIYIYTHTIWFVKC